MYQSGYGVVFMQNIAISIALKNAMFKKKLTWKTS